MPSNKLKYIFIGGCGRSGTTLVQKLLVLHSKITGNGEFDFLPHLMQVHAQMIEPTYLKRQSFFYSKEQLEAHWNEFIKVLLTSNIDTNQFEYISEKTPNNIFCAEQLLELIPDSKFVYVYRDGRDVISSFKQVKKRAGEKGEQLQNSIKDWALMWNNASHNYLQLKKNRKFDNRHIGIRYEDLVNDPKNSLLLLMDFLELPFEEHQLIHGTANKDPLSLKLDEVWYTSKMYNQDINTANIAKWKKDLTWSQKLAYQTIMAVRLKEYNYPVSSFYIKLHNLIRALSKKLSYK